MFSVMQINFYHNPTNCMGIGSTFRYLLLGVLVFQTCGDTVWESFPFSYGEGKFASPLTNS